jgi:hypothetical protein
LYQPPADQRFVAGGAEEDGLMSQRDVRRTALVALLIGLVVFASLLAASFSGAAGFTKGREIAPFPTEFVPGDYIWHPEISPAGPVVVLVSLPDQVLYVFRNGVRIGRSTVSTGNRQCARIDHTRNVADRHGCAGRRGHSQRFRLQHPHDVPHAAVRAACRRETTAPGPAEVTSGAARRDA